MRAETDSPPVDPTAALRQLEKFEEMHAQSSGNRRRGALEMLRQGAGSGDAAAKLYEQAVEGTGQGNMADWRRKNADLLRAKPFQDAVQLHLGYLLLSVDGAREQDPSVLAESSWGYARALAAKLAEKDFRQRPDPARVLLDKPVSESVFARWLRLGPFLPRGGDWEAAPGNLAGILEKNVRPVWRESGNPRLDDTWQLEIETGAALAKADNSDRVAEDFDTRTAPTLLFRRARDRAAAGQPNRAASDILELARRHPDHPDFPQWAATLREMLGKKATAPSDAGPSSAIQP